MKDTTTEFNVIIDRFEGDGPVFAVIELPDLDHFVIPVNYLPAGVSEGESLLMKFTTDPGTTARNTAEIRKLQDELLKKR